MEANALVVLCPIPYSLSSTSSAPSTSLSVDLHHSMFLTASPVFCVFLFRGE